MASSDQTFISNLDGNDIIRYFGDLALSNQYQVNISGLSNELEDHLAKFGIDKGGIVADVGILCSDANLPTSSFATAEVKDNFIGVTQEFAHTRLYTDLDFTFYVDKNYNVIRFFEGWMDYISGGNIQGEPPASTDARGTIYRRFNYPKYYKTSGLYIIKFERDLASEYKRTGTEYNYRLKYRFINAFPKSLTTVPVSYGPAELLKVTVSFNFDRYITSRDETTTIVPSSSQFRGNITNIVRKPPPPQPSPEQPVSAEEASTSRIRRPLGQEIGVTQRGTILGPGQ